jgi:type I restriction enzyme S subunit
VLKNIKKVSLSEVLTESKVESTSPDVSNRLRVRLNTKGIEKRPDTNDKEGATKYYIRKAGQFVYGRQNLHKGAFGIVPEHLDGFESSSDIPAFDVHDNCLPEWVELFLKQGNYYLHLEKHASGVGSKRISPKIFLSLEMPLPQVEFQRKILAKINLYLEIQKNLNSEIKHQQSLLKKLRQQILQEAIEGKLTAGWRAQHPDVEPASKLLERIAAEKAELIKAKKIKPQKQLPKISDSEKPYELPKGWEWCRLGGITNIVRGGSPRPAGDKRFYEGNIPFLKVADLTATTNMYLHKHTYTIKEAGLNKTRLVPENTLMLTNSGATLGIPKICSFKTTFNDGVAAFIDMHAELYKPFFYYLLASKTDWYLNVASRGQGQPNLNTEIIGATEISLPPLIEQKAIVAKVEKLLAMCDELEIQINANETNAEQLMQAVLKEAFTQNN